MMLPEQLGQFSGQFAGLVGIAIGHDQAIASQFRDIGKGITNHHASRQSHVGGFELLAEVNTLSKETRCGDQFIASHEGRYLDPGGDRLYLVTKNSQQ